MRKTKIYAPGLFFITLALGIMGFVNLGPTVITTTAFTLQAINFTAAGTEAVITLTPSRDFVDGSTGTSFAVTAKSSLKLQQICVTTKNAGAAGQGVIVRVRVNPTGAATVSSPVVLSIGAGTNLAIAGVVNTTCSQFGDGTELAGTNQIAISQIGTATAGNDVTITGYERRLD